MSSPKPNPNVPPVPQPFADVGSLAYVALALKQGMDSLGGNAGVGSDPLGRAVTFNDLIALGLITKAQATSSAVLPRT